MMGTLLVFGTFFLITAIVAPPGLFWLAVLITQMVFVEQHYKYNTQTFSLEMMYLSRMPLTILLLKPILRQSMFHSLSISLTIPLMALFVPLKNILSIEPVYYIHSLGVVFAATILIALISGMYAASVYACPVFIPVVLLLTHHPHPLPLLIAWILLALCVWLCFPSLASSHRFDLYLVLFGPLQISRS